MQIILSDGEMRALLFRIDRHIDMVYEQGHTVSPDVVKLQDKLKIVSRRGAPSTQYAFDFEEIAMFL